jgi:hypothetical protein
MWVILLAGMIVMLEGPVLLAVSGIAVGGPPRAARPAFRDSADACVIAGLPAREGQLARALAPLGIESPSVTM